ncbi:MAG: IS66 family insertion sequence element accessory protein TnpA [Methylocella sp.]
MANHQRDSKREAFWRGVLKRYTASGLAIRAFCQREQLTESAFYVWRRTISQRGAEAKRSRQPAFLPVLVDGHHGHDGAIVIELAGGRVLRLSEAISPARLADIVSALEHRERSA